MFTMSNSQKTYVYKTFNKHEILADVFPALNSTGLIPTIIWIHGGGLIFGSRKRINKEQLKRYISIGFNVVSIDYRLAPETKLHSIIEDIKDAYKWVRETGTKLFHGDPNRIAVIGHSAGGHLSLLYGSCFNPKPKVLVSFYGYGDITGVWCSSPSSFYCKQSIISKEEAFKAVSNLIITEGNDSRYLFYLYCRQHGIWNKKVSGYDHVKETSAILSLCPIHNISDNFPPTLFIHGDKDEDVPCQQSVDMSKKLDSVGVENKLVIIPNAGHVFDDNLQNRKYQMFLTKY